MLICNVRGKKFKSKEALGGHMSSAHPQNKPENLDYRIDLRPQVDKGQK